MVVFIVIGKEMKWEWGLKDIIILILDKIGVITVLNFFVFCLSLLILVVYKKYVFIVILIIIEVSFLIIFFRMGVNFGLL